MGLGEVSVQEFGKNTDVLLRVQKQEGGNKEQVEALNKIKKLDIDLLIDKDIDLHMDVDSI